MDWANRKPNLAGSDPSGSGTVPLNQLHLLLGTWRLNARSLLSIQRANLKHPKPMRPMTEGYACPWCQAKIRSERTFWLARHSNRNPWQGFEPLWKNCKSIGMIVPSIWENNSHVPVTTNQMKYRDVPIMAILDYWDIPKNHLNPWDGTGTDLCRTINMHWTNYHFRSLPLIDHRMFHL